MSVDPAFAATAASSWFPKLAGATPEAVLIPCIPALCSYLLQDGVVLPPSFRPPPSGGSSSSDVSDDDSDDSDDGGRPKPLREVADFPDLAAAIQVLGSGTLLPPGPGAPTDCLVWLGVADCDRSSRRARCIPAAELERADRCGVAVGRRHAALQDRGASAAAAERIGQDRRCLADGGALTPR